MMALNSIFPWWVMIIVFAPPVAFVVWRLIASWHTPQRNLWVRRVCVVGVLLLMALRPSVTGGGAPSQMANMDVIFVVDVTSSMAAEDYDGTSQRLVGARQDIKDIALSMPGARYGVITFSLAAAKELPLTTDATALESLVDIIEQEQTMYSRGSSLDVSLPMLEEELERLRERSPERQLVVYFMSDGEQTSDGQIKSFERLAHLIDAGAVLGYGTQEGARMKQFSSSPTFQPLNPYITDFTAQGGPDAISRIDETNLQTIAQQMGVPYTWRQTPGDIEQFIQTVDLDSLQDEQRDVSTYRDTYWLLAVLLVGLVLWEVWSLRSVFYDLRKKGEKV